MAKPVKVDCTDAIRDIIKVLKLPEDTPVNTLPGIVAFQRGGFWGDYADTHGVAGMGLIFGAMYHWMHLSELATLDVVADEIEERIAAYEEELDISAMKDKIIKQLGDRVRQLDPTYNTDRVRVDCMRCGYVTEISRPLPPLSVQLGAGGEITR